ncbi:MAG TPA: hypothetical protein VLB29_19835 [Nocardioidaceae bacterium]|nr:hypothetical protein [Nocardioidaceae bacterium]
MTLTRGKKIALLVLAAFLVWLIVWIGLAANPLSRDSETGPATPYVVSLR